jgi:glucose-1-phosphate adenylyltransferase
MGIYVFNKRILAERLIEDAGSPISRHDFGYSLLPNMVKRDRVFAYQFKGYWQDIGTIEAYYRANMELTKEIPGFSLNSSTPVMTHQQLLSPPYTNRQTKITNSLISPGCVVKGHVENSVLSPGVWIDEHAMVKNSVIMGNAFIGRQSVISHCVLDEDVTIDDYCCLGLGSGVIPGDPVITVLGKGVMVPSFTSIGRNCKIMPHVSASDFVTNIIPSGTILSRHSLPGAKSKKVAVGES